MVSAIIALAYWIVGVDILDQVNNTFPLIDNIGLSFTMLSSAEIARELVKWEFLPADATIHGSSS